MNNFDWKPFLHRWSESMLASSWVDELPADVRVSGWLGFPSASERELEEAEARLKIPLPPSYRFFLRASNGWRRTTHAIQRLRGTHELKWFREGNRDWIKAYTSSSAYGPVEPTPDAEYFAYGTPQDFRPKHLRETLQISEVGDSAVYLLNPQVIDKDGEWEAWFFADWLPGVHRYRSFLEMMLAEHSQFAGTPWKQPVGVHDGLPDEYVGSPGTTTRKKKVRRATREPKVLGRRLSEWTTEELVQMLTIDEWHVQEDAAQALGKLGDRAALDPLLALAKADESHASAIALRSAVKLAPDETREVLLDTIRQRSRSTLFSAISLCAELKENRALPLLIDILRDPDPHAAHLTELVGKLIAQFGAEGMHALSELLADDAPHVRRRAAGGLMYTNNPKASAYLTNALTDPDPQVRETAALGLKVLPSQRST